MFGLQDYFQFLVIKHSLEFPSFKMNLPNFILFPSLSHGNSYTAVPVFETQCRTNFIDGLIHAM